jgi:hypothetical protein
MTVVNAGCERAVLAVASRIVPGLPSYDSIAGRKRAYPAVERTAIC